MSNWHDNPNSDKVARSFAWRVMVGVIIFVLFIGLISAGVWAFRVATAPVKGQGDAFVQKESATNRIGAQARFEDLYADIQATDAKLAPAKQALKRNPNSQIKQTEFTGLQNYCLDVVADYQAESRKYLSADFKAFDLPVGEVLLSDPSTDCKP